MKHTAIVSRSVAAISGLALACAGAVVAPGTAAASECTPVDVVSRTFDLTAAVGEVAAGTTYCLVLSEGVLLDGEGWLDSVVTAVDTGRPVDSRSIVDGWSDLTHTMTWTVPAPVHGQASPELQMDTSWPYHVVVDYDWMLVGPSAPTGAAAEATGATSVHVSWDAAPAGSFAVAAYDVRYRAEGAESFTSAGSTEGLEKDLSGLDPSTAYEIEVRARDIDDRASAYSVAVSATTAAAVAPTVPTGLAAETTGTDSVALTWSASDAGTYPVASYVVRYRAVGDMLWTALAPVEGTEATVDALDSSTDYEFTVEACDAHEHCSAATDPATATTDAVILPAPLRPQVSTPDAVVTGGTVELTVSDVPGDAIVEAGDLAEGVAGLEVDGLVVSLTTTHGFSGTIEQPLLVDDGRGAVEVTATITVVPDPATLAVHRVTSATASSVRWTAAAGATGYVVKVAGTTVCTTSTTVCAVPRLLGPASVVTVTATGNDATTAAAARSTWGSTATALGHVHFVGDSAVLTPSSITALRALAGRLASAGVTRLTVHGFTATTSSATRTAAQLRLSGERADAAAAVITAAYAARGASVRIVRVAEGATRPVASNATYAGRSENRRAEIVLG